MTIIEITSRFPNDLSCIKHFEKVRWGAKPKCVHCNSKDISKRREDFRFFCNECRKSFSVKTNTKLHDSRLPLKTWLYAFALVSDAKKGLSAKQLQRNLGLTYKTAWSMYMRIRELMSEKVRKLKQVVEMDETYVGGKPRKPNNVVNFDKSKREKVDSKIKELKEKGVKIYKGKTPPKKFDTNIKRGRGTKKIPVVGIVQRDGNVVAQVMQKLTYENLSSMVKKHVEKEKSVLITDEYKGYNRISKIIDHIRIDHEKLYSYRGINTNTIESFWAIVKRGIIGQYHKVSPKYLPQYVTEFVFKFNNRKEDDMFETLVKNAMQIVKKEYAPIKG